jgi:hypothetical protein
MTFYIRLLSYAEACRIIKFVDNIPCCYANITTNGVQVNHSDQIDKDIIEHELNLHYTTFEFTEIPPHEVNKKIIKDLGLKNFK